LPPVNLGINLNDKFMQDLWCFLLEVSATTLKATHLYWITCQTSWGCPPHINACNGSQEVTSTINHAINTYILGQGMDPGCLILSPACNHQAKDTITCGHRKCWKSLSLEVCTVNIVFWLKLKRIPGMHCLILHQILRTYIITNKKCRTNRKEN